MTPQLVQKKFDLNYYESYISYLTTVKKFKQIGEGASRIGFQRDNIVIKVPWNNQGFIDNIIEAYAYRQYRNIANVYGIVFAPCRLLSNACLMMPYVVRMSYDDLPRWAQRIDGAQAGRYKGRVVAYDSAYDLRSLRKHAMEWASLS